MLHWYKGYPSHSLAQSDFKSHHSRRSQIPTYIQRIRNLEPCMSFRFQERNLNLHLLHCNKGCPSHNITPSDFKTHHSRKSQIPTHIQRIRNLETCMDFRFHEKIRTWSHYIATTGAQTTVSLNIFGTQHLRVVVRR